MQHLSSSYLYMGRTCLHSLWYCSQIPIIRKLYGQQKMPIKVGKICFQDTGPQMNVHKRCYYTVFTIYFELTQIQLQFQMTVQFAYDFTKEGTLRILKM